MRARKMREGIHWLGAIDWERRLFDSLIPLPDGTSYNAYLVEGSEKRVLLDTVDPAMTPKLMAQLEEVEEVDYVISHHAEQDHSGAIPEVLKRYPRAKVICTPKARPMLESMLGISGDRIETVEDGETLSLGDQTLTFLHTPWVHWPETMVTYLEEEGILFSCDFFGSHIATSDLYVTDEGRVLEAAKRYFAEIMMPFRKIIARNLEKLSGREISLIATSHGPIYDRPGLIMDAYREWSSDETRDLVVIPYVSMHGSTWTMVDHLASALVDRGVAVELFDLSVVDIGKLAMALMDARTIVLGAPTVLGGPHPLAAYAAFLSNALRPRARYISILGSYGWGGKAVETISGMIPNLKVEVIPPVLARGIPCGGDLEALEAMADTIAARHHEGEETRS